MGSIYFGGPMDYNMAVYNVYAKIAENPVGRVIIDAINRTKKDLTFVPYNKGKQALYGDNAVTAPDDAAAGAPEGVSQAGKAYWYRGNDDNPYTRADERYDMVPPGMVGTGKGSDVTIYFTPDTRQKSGCNTGTYGSQPDEVLFHEMVHALRYMQGKSNAIPTEDSARGYDTEEEFLAIVVANVYMSAKKCTQLRADHHGHRPLQPPLNNSAGFLTDSVNLKLMNIYYLIWKPIFLALSQVTGISFNPFHELVTNWQLQRNPN